MAQSKKRGPPSSYAPAIADRICEELADGKSLRAICKAADMPHRATVFRWLAANEEFQRQYAIAHEAQADALAEEILDISDTPVMGEKITVKPDGKKEISRGDMIEHRRLQVHARMWLAAKLKPKKYGDKVSQEISGPGGTPLTVNVKQFTPPPGEPDGD